MNDQRSKLSSLKGFTITDIKKSVRHGNCFEINLRKASKLKMIVVSCDTLYDSYGNFFDTNNIEYREA